MNTVKISVATLRNLITMAESSPQYIAGYAWTVCALVEARKAVDEVRRQATPPHENRRPRLRKTPFGRNEAVER